jgi:hypothetical protein
MRKRHRCCGLLTHRVRLQHVSSIGLHVAVECQLAIALAQHRPAHLDAPLLCGFRGGLVPAFAVSFAFASFFAASLAAAWVAFAFAVA